MARLVAGLQRRGGFGASRVEVVVVEEVVEEGEVERVLTQVEQEPMPNSTSARAPRARGVMPRR